ncbi:hypothetical protein BDZ97DRAFT_1139938 [Flammula alnicola]|nr:hypothetical protein BDZ97DRAFT_1139938 [Flammula alnicola]
MHPLQLFFLIFLFHRQAEGHSFGPTCICVAARLCLSTPTVVGLLWWIRILRSHRLWGRRRSQVFPNPNLISAEFIPLSFGTSASIDETMPLLFIASATCNSWHLLDN